MSGRCSSKAEGNPRHRRQGRIGQRGIGAQRRRRQVRRGADQQLQGVAFAVAFLLQLYGQRLCLNQQGFDLGQIQT